MQPPQNGSSTFADARLITGHSNLSALYDAITTSGEFSYVLQSLEVLQQAFRLYGPDNVCVAFNGGKDATVILYLALLALSRMPSTEPPPKLNCLYLHDDANFTEVTEFIQTAIKQLHELVSFSSFQMDILQGIRSFMASRHDGAVCCFVMGTRRADPHGADMAAFEPSSLSWPAFMRVNPIIPWDYHQVWRFLQTFRIPFCPLYAAGYTSLGNVHNTIPNPALKVGGEHENKYRPAWLLEDGTLERAGRIKKK